jgi:hypothetical protein
VIELGPLAVGIAQATLAGFPNQRLQEAIDRLDAADAIIAATPVYKARVSGLFKSSSTSSTTTCSPSEPSREPLGDWLPRWFERDAVAWARSTRLQRAGVLDRWIAPYLARVRLRDLGPRSRSRLAR